jgi:hypothetical protein
MNAGMGLGEYLVQAHKIDIALATRQADHWRRARNYPVPEPGSLRVLARRILGRP